MPMPRRFNVAAPDVFVAPGWMSNAENCVPAGTNCGRSFSTPSMLVLLLLTKLSLSIVTIGLGAVKSRRTMREPVTVISSTPCCSGACSCAYAVPPMAADTAKAKRCLASVFTFPPGNICLKSSEVVAVPQHSVVTMSRVRP